MPSILVVAAKMAGTVASPSRFLRSPLGSMGCGGSLLGVFHSDLASFTGALDLKLAPTDNERGPSARLAGGSESKFRVAVSVKSGSLAQSAKFARHRWCPLVSQPKIQGITLVRLRCLPLISSRQGPWNVDL